MSETQKPTWEQELFEKQRERDLKEEIRQKALLRFEYLRHDLIEEIPEKLLELGDPNYDFYKCRDIFFVDVAGWASRLLGKGLITGVEATAKAQEFMNFWQHKQDAAPRTVPADIQKANDFLDYLIN